MDDIARKRAAAITAVACYLQLEAEAAAAAALPAAPTAEPAAAGPKPWALAGRQGQMQLRTLMQLRAFGRGT